MEKVHIEKNTVQETLVIPLYGRKMCTERFPGLFRDDKAVELISRLDYDFSALDKKASGLIYRFGALEVAMREGDLMAEMKEYLALHPAATLVNLGCGLDQTCENIDNGTCRILNIDLPDVIAVRDRLLPGTERIENLGHDINDPGWFDRVDASGGVCFMAAGVFYYFKREQIRALFTAMEKRFPGGKLVFDAAGRRAVKMMLKTWVKEAGITSIDECFSVDDIGRDLGFLARSQVTSRGYMLGYSDLRDPAVPPLFRLLARSGDGMMGMKIVRIDFDE